MNPDYKKYFVFKLIVLILLMQTSGILLNLNVQLFAQNNQNCADILEKAEDAYYDGEFDTTLTLINNCLKLPDIGAEQRSMAYIILARTFIATNESEKSTQFINKILDLDRNYAPTIEQETPKFVMMVNQVIQERKTQTKLEEETGISSWIWIGAGGIVATAAVIAIISSGDNNPEKKDGSLPEPPEFP